MADYLGMIGIENIQQAVSYIVRLVVAALCGAVIGIDRERRKRPAGLRTHMLVCLGAALVMITGEQISLAYPGGDMTRMSAQVISGIGFLGAGTIIVDRQNRIRGLTTAAGLWTSACIGLAIGSGYYIGGLVACVLTVVIVAAFLGLEKRFSKKAEIMDFYVEFESAELLYSFITHIVSMDYRISAFSMAKPGNGGDGHAAANITIFLPSPVEHISIMQNLGNFRGIVSIREV